MSSLTSLMFVTLSVLQVRTEWISSSPSTLPKADRQMAVAYYNQTMFLLGGYMGNYPRSLIQYDIENDNLISYDIDALSTDTNGRSYYTQIGNILYMIDRETGLYINTYNLKTNQFIHNALDKQIPIDVGAGSFECLTSIHSELYVIGGRDGTIGTLDTVHIFTISSNSWRNGPPMLQTRDRSTCAASSITNKMYAIGGDSNGYLKSVEFISVLNIDTNVWEYTNDLSEGLRAMTSAVYGAFIYAIGGMHTAINNIQDLPFVYIIDTRTNIVSLSTQSMADAGGFGRNPTAIIIGSRLYSFGGYPNGLSSDTWQYYDLPTSEPTTFEPTTFEPITFEPTTFEPTTFEPTTSHPTTNSPTTDLSTSTIRITSSITSEISLESVTLITSTLYRATFGQTTAEPTIATNVMSETTVHPIRSAHTTRVTSLIASTKPILNTVYYWIALITAICIICCCIVFILVACSYKQKPQIISSKPNLSNIVCCISTADIPQRTEGHPIDVDNVLSANKTQGYIDDYMEEPNIKSDEFVIEDENDVMWSTTRGNGVCNEDNVIVDSMRSEGVSVQQIINKFNQTKVFGTGVYTVK